MRDRQGYQPVEFPSISRRKALLAISGGVGGMLGLTISHNFLRNKENFLDTSTGIAEASPSTSYPLPEGRFYNETNAGAPEYMGYSVTREMWRIYSQFGREDLWGPPISQQYTDEIGRESQAFQRGIFQLSMREGRAANVEWANVFDSLSAKGKDGWLEVVRQTPVSNAWDSDRGKSWHEIVDNHLALLDENPAIKQSYMNDPMRLEKFGLPMSIKNYGDQIAVRFQRAVFQQWLVDVPWARSGQVVVALGGDIAKELGEIIPRHAVELETFGTGGPELRPFPDTIGELSRDNVMIINRDSRIGVIDNKGTPNNWPAVVSVAKQYASSDKFRLIFYDNPAQVPQVSEPQKYDTRVYWNLTYPGAELGKQLRVQNADGAWEHHLSLPNVRSEDLAKLNSDVTRGVLRFFISKDNVRTTWGSDFAAILVRQGPTNGTTSLIVRYS